MFKSLKSKTMIMMIVLILVPLLVLGVTSLIKFQTSTVEATQEKLDDLLELTSEAILDEINQAALVARLISKDKHIIEFLSGDQSLRKEVHEFLKEEQGENNELIEMLILTDEKGMSLTAHSAEVLEIDVSDRGYVQSALAGELGISDVLISRATEAPIIAVAYPVYDNGKLVGTVISTVHFMNVSDHVGRIQVFEGGYAYLFMKDGIVVSHPNPDHIMSLQLKDVDKATALMVEDINQGKRGEQEYTFEGVDKYVRYMPVAEWGLAITANYDDYMRTSIETRNLALIILLVSSIIALIVAYLYSEYGLIKPIRKLQHGMTLAGEGDLSVHVDIKGKDEIADMTLSFNKMVGEQSNIVAQVKESAIQLNQSSEDVAHTTGELSLSSDDISKKIMSVAENSSRQNDAMIDTSEVLLQLSSLIQLAKQRAMTAESSVNLSLDVANAGRASVEKTIHVIQEIDQSTEETRVVLGVLEDLSVKVRGVIDTINGIAEQTNLLALNASIEAARAGEHGKGFAVVAMEVGKLAEQTSDEASGITSVVQQMVNNISSAVKTMETSRKAVADGVTRSKETDEAFIKIFETVDQIASDITEIVSVTDEKVATSDKILSLINSVSSLSESNAANSQAVAASAEEQTAISETIAASSQELTAMAQNLEELVERFNLGGDK